MRNKKEIILLIIFIVLQSILYVCTGMSKGYIHIDEAYSFGLTNYDKVEIASKQYKRVDGKELIFPNRITSKYN